MMQLTFECFRQRIRLYFIDIDLLKGDSLMKIRGVDQTTYAGIQTRYFAVDE